MISKRAAICVGHSRLVNGKAEGGAVSVGGVSEWKYNLQLAKKIAARLEANRFFAPVYSIYQGNGYSSAMSWIAKQILKDNCNVAIELHFNSSDRAEANGHEWLHWHKSKPSTRLATAFDQGMHSKVPEIHSRGCKPIQDGDRGSLFLRLTHCPAVICEPFFGSSKVDWKHATEMQDDIAEVISDAILGFLK